MSKVKHIITKQRVEDKFSLYFTSKKPSYEEFKEAILNLADDIEIEPKKLYIAFKKDKNISDIVILKKGLKLFINLQIGQLEDPKGLMRDVSKTGHWGNGDYETIIKNTKDLEYIMSLIKQAIV